MTDKIGYKLADGTMSTDYEVGDTFEVVGLEGSSLKVGLGDIVTLTTNDDTWNPYFDEGDIRKVCGWEDLKATPETLNRVNNVTETNTPVKTLADFAEEQTPIKTPRQILEVALMEVYNNHGIVITDLDVDWINTNSLGKRSAIIEEIRVEGELL